ncbi:MAG: hypothetical protein ACQEVT_18645, partial [Pseudomonadota bacterium]
MKNDTFLPPSEASQADRGQFELTYGEFLEMVKERRLTELEENNPGEAKRNTNIAGNMVRAMRAFMAVNDLRKKDLIGQEILDQTAWEQARDRIGPAKASQKSLAGKARVWALETVRAQETRYADETFGARLARLRALRELSYSDLSSFVSTGIHRTDWSVFRNWELGVRHPAPESIATVQRLEEVLKAPPGSLVGKMPKVPNRARSIDIDLPRQLKRRVSQHLPADFESRDPTEQDEILTWVADNILSTPKEMLDDGSTSPAMTADVFFFALTREPGRRTKMAAPRLLREIDEIGNYKTASIPPLGMKRNKRWGTETKNKGEYEMLSFFGALDLLGLPSEAQSVSLFLAPEAIERFVSWRHERRGGYTGTLVNLLQSIASFL